LLNPKALLFASAIFPESAWMNVQTYIVHILSFLCLILPIAVFWIFLGSVLASNKIHWLNACNLTDCIFGSGEFFYSTKLFCNFKVLNCASKNAFVSLNDFHWE
jgi:hypothetical protein